MGNVSPTPENMEYSRSPTVTSTGDASAIEDKAVSSEATYTGLAELRGTTAKEEQMPSQSTMGKVESEMEAKDGVQPQQHNAALAEMSAGRKSVLVLCFCLSMFIDAAGISATFVMTAPISDDLGIAVGDQVWILGTYSLSFAACLLFAGRLADLYPPHRVYGLGFIGIAVLYLIISFMTNQYAFFVLRAVSGVLSVLTIPSSINMIIQMYPEPAEQGQKLALFGLAGALANTIALILGGVFLLASWRWYFRFVAILIAPLFVIAWYLLPKTEAVVQDVPGSTKFKRMDLVGVFILIAALVLFILGFTQATVDGWNSAIFIAPFVVSIALLAAFLVWEHYLPRGYSLLPHDLWSYPNIFPLIIQALVPFMWLATVQLRSATYFQEALGDSPIMSGVKLLPMGITAIVAGMSTQFMPFLITKPRFIQPIGSLLAFTGSMLIAFSRGGDGMDYWKFMFPGQVIGTIGGMFIYIGMNTSIIQAFPLEFAGVGGSFANIIFQIGGIMGISIQAGLLETGDGTIQDWDGSKNSYFFTGGFVLFTGAVFAAWYRQHLMPKLEGPMAVV